MLLQPKRTESMDVDSHTQFMLAIAHSWPPLLLTANPHLELTIPLQVLPRLIKYRAVATPLWGLMGCVVSLVPTCVFGFHNYRPVVEWDTG